MKKALTFIAIGLVLAVAAEMFRFMAVEQQGVPWVPMIVAYVVLLAAGYAVSARMKSNLEYYALCGIFGLLLEVFALGMLGQIMDAGILGWAMWFSYWGSIFLIPRLYLRGELKAKSLLVMVGLLAVFVIFFLATRNTGSAGLFAISLNIPYVLWHFRKK